MAWRCWVIEKFCASTTGLNVVGGFAAAGTACTANTARVAITPARNIAPDICPSGPSVNPSRLDCFRPRQVLQPGQAVPGTVRRRRTQWQVLHDVAAA